MRPETSVGAGPAGQSGQPSANVPGEDTAPSPRQVLRFLATVLHAKAAVEIGTSGDGTRATLRGMAAEGTLTSIDVDPHAQRAARDALAEDGISTSRVRLITGPALEVLPRLTEGGYDLVAVRTASPDPLAYLELGLRLLRPGGVIVFDGIRLDAPRTARDRPTLAARELLRTVRAEEFLVPVALPVGSGMLAVAKNA